MEAPLTDRVVDHVQQHPYQALAAAAGVGFVLGGGLFTRPALTAMGVGLRVAVLPVIRREFLGIVAGALVPRVPPETDR